MDTLVSVLGSGDDAKDESGGAAADRLVQLVRKQLLPALNASFFLSAETASSFFRA